MKPGRLKGSVPISVTQSRVEKELLQYLAAQPRAIEPAKLYGPLAEKCGVSAAAQTAPRRDRNESAWNNLVQQARRRLVNLRYVAKPPPKGLWALTATGRETAAALTRGVTFEDLWPTDK